MEQSELLFFDTFSHESSEELNLDLVQFTKTVCVTEIRVIPLGARVQADFPGGVRLGATNPSQFSIEFFVNDLSKPGASTFESVGDIEYNQNGNIHVECESRIPTDGLVLRGWYTTITLAVYGFLTKAVVTEPPGPVCTAGPLQPQAGAPPAQEWAHTQVSGDYMETSRDMYGPATYSEDSYPHPDYPPYQDNWPQAEGYKYEGEWDQRPGEEKAWDRKERERDMRHREFREHGRECSPEYERGRYYRGWGGRPRTPPPPHPPAEVEMSPPDHGTTKKESTSPQAAFDSLSPGDVESISEGEIPEAEGEGEGEPPPPPAVATPPALTPPPPALPPTPQAEDHSLDVEPFEPILSDEEIADDSDPQDMDYDFSEYPDDPLKTFNPYTCELPALLHLSDPANELLPNVAASRISEVLRSAPTERTTGAHKEAWVHSVEQLVTLLPCQLTDECVDQMISWVEVGLDFSEALNQPQPGYKLRHIKAGVRLAEAICRCGERVTERLVAAVDVHQRLLDLFHQEYMALSIKLMILRSLDAALRYRSAVERFLRAQGYRKLVEMVRGRQLARVQFAITSLLRKLNVYEVLNKLNRSVGELVMEEGKDSEAETAEIDLENIANSLEEIVRVYNDAPMLISQPKRFLPVSAQFELSCVSAPDPYPALMTYCRTHRLLETLLILLTHPATSCYPSVVTPAHELLACLQDSQQGLRFLAAIPDTINPLVRGLLGSQPDDSQLGLHLVYRLQALSHVDGLLHCYHQNKTDPDDPEVFDHLQSLFCLTFSAVGKMGVVHVLSRGDHMSVLLNYFRAKTVEKDTKVKKSPGKSYAADLITMTVKFSDHVPFLQKYSKELIEMIGKDSGQELNELMPWLKPVENPSVFAYDDISSLVEILKKNIENATSLPGELITAVRVLKYLGIPPRDKELSLPAPDSLEYVELKYKCVIIQLFSLEGVTHLGAVLQRLCEHYEQPSLHSARLVGRQGLSLLALLHPALQLVRRVLTQVIRCRNTEYKDLTMIPVLLQTYALMQAIPLSAHAHFQAQKVCRDIVETLLAFTQPVTSEPSTETEALNKSLWTLMMTEVFKFTVSTPNNFLPGLSLLSELLPLPLQVQSRSPLPDEEITRVVNCRKLWSAHLHCLSSLIHEMISTMCSSSYNPLLQLLRSVCVQLADLAAPTALTVTRAVLDTIVKAVSSEWPVSSHMMRLLTFLACLATHAPVKAALLHLTIRNNSDKTQRYPDLIVSLCHILRANHESPTHVQAQECILSVIQSLCHCELTLVPPPGILQGGAVSTEMYLANTLPPRDLLGTLTLVMLEHAADPGHSQTTVQGCLRAFLMLTEHDYGFFHLKNCLEKKPDALYNVVTKIVSVWGPEARETLSCLLELLRGCLTPDAPDEVLGLPARTFTVTAPELANLLGWGRHSDSKHPLYAVNTLLQESRAEDESLETLCENVTELIRLLESDGSKPLEPKELSEPLLPAPDSLLAQWSARPVFVVGDVEDDRLTVSYWLTVPQPDDQDSDMQQVGCDLMEVARVELPDLPLAERLATLCRHKAAPGDLEHGNPPGKKRSNNMASETNTRRPFIAPMRGRGFRGAVQRGDMFRSRPPNTSRPPSLHVDDFVALETCGQQPTGPTGYNKISMRVAQDMIATRVRGRARPFSGGRFFPTPYARRDNGNGRGGLSPHWHGEGPSGGGSGPGGGGFRAPPPPHGWPPHMRFFSR
ncbi:protein virilizer isoform X2 [Homalodisca vitripennis]|uniref:protein virilizer isoform X2 n=1 Tax=Homalodisca vitripennis TaxID=197043 RepID=UPI001EEC6450|nr:protein virilizer isoform X2 [Homalodisca vitripennis]